MARLSTKPGDVFSVNLGNNTKRYFQYITNDLRQLNSDVIRVFKATYSLDENPDISAIIKDEVTFYAHCTTKLGLKLGLWVKIGNTRDVGRFDHILFRDTNDYGTKAGEEPIKISHNWYVWKIGDERSLYVGELAKENQSAEIGIVVNPYDIVERLKFGRYNFFYPDYQ